jgi:hypothetical protein
MRARRIFAAPRVYPSDNTGQHPRRAGMRGLRHKARHRGAWHLWGEPPNVVRSAPRREYGDNFDQSNFFCGSEFLQRYLLV